MKDLKNKELICEDFIHNFKNNIKNIQQYIIINGVYYTIKYPSCSHDKHYDVYLGKAYLCSFGNINVKHYFDKFGRYEGNNHYDKIIRQKYRANIRKQHPKLYPYMSVFWEYNYLN